jgi:hypothetical protein
VPSRAKIELIRVDRIWSAVGTVEGVSTCPGRLDIVAFSGTVFVTGSGELVLIADALFYLADLRIA